MLAIARALLLNPALLLMDEPSEGLAPVVVDLLIDKFAELARTGLRILLIEQNLELTTALAEDILLLDNGRVEARTSAAVLKADRQLLERFLGVSQRV
jgi:branched-chain amino acid transport system ATP-binding protein